MELKYLDVKEQNRQNLSNNNIRKHQYIACGVDECTCTSLHCRAIHI